MIAILRYGSGFPLHRLERLEQSLGIALPASIQWEIVCLMAVRIRPASDELDYSNRSARTGSTRAARRAGIQHAPRATNNNSPATVEMVSASFAEIP